MIGDNTYKRGLLLCLRNLQHSTRGRVTTSTPMKRGLKVVCLHKQPVNILRNNLYPDEKGTERSPNRLSHECEGVTTSTPMKRGLKGLIDPDAKGQEAM